MTEGLFLKQTEHVEQRPLVIGLYGVSGCGKTHLLQLLKGILSEEQFAYFEGSTLIAEVAGSIEAFSEMSSDQQQITRGLAISRAQEHCKAKSVTGIVAGHYSFLRDDDIESISTEKDWEVFTHIFYVHTPPEIVIQQRKDDKMKDRGEISRELIEKWQFTEVIQLREKCFMHHIPFSRIGYNELLRLESLIINATTTYCETDNDQRVMAKLKIGNVPSRKPKALLVFDADRILAPFETGRMFFWHLSRLDRTVDPLFLDRIFAEYNDYSIQAFRRAMYLYEETNEAQFDQICEEIAHEVKLYPEITALIQYIAQYEEVDIKVVTSGIGRVWSKILEKHGLLKYVEVVGGCRIADGYLVTRLTKEHIVLTMRQQNPDLIVFAFGDSPVDQAMLKAADHAYVVVGETGIRSRSMEKLLRDTISVDFRPRQILLPPGVPCRLNEDLLPLIDITKRSFLDKILPKGSKPIPITIEDATNTSACKLLAGPTRDPNVNSVALRQAHQRIGHFLAINYISKVTGLESYQIPHVKGGATMAHRFLDEENTTIVAAMRAGEPLAFGINEAMPKTMFVHSKDPKDLTAQHISGQSNVVLADFVINTGQTIIDFIEHIRSIHATIRIIVVAGVVQEDFVKRGILDKYANVRLVTLRISENKYKGQGGSDTGNRLFNTTHVD